MKLTTQKIEEIAKLARLELTNEEKELYAQQLTAILDYVEQLNEVDTDNITETCQVTGLKNVVREDVAKDSNDIDNNNIISNFPEKLDRFLKVKAVFNE